MSDPENFLTRWSRRKREAGDTPDKNATDEKDSASASPSAELEAELERLSTEGAPGEAAEPVVDLSQLPSIESITAETDIRSFFAPGVPAELRLAALRRAWVADPQVRDFVGLADYDFDFNTPGAIPGFGPLDMTDDQVRREVARIVGDMLPDPEGEGEGTVRSPTQSMQPAEAAQETSGTREEPPESAEDRADPASIDGEVPPVEPVPGAVPTHPNQEFAASQQTIESPESLQTSARRSHGGALPK